MSSSSLPPKLKALYKSKRVRWLVVGITLLIAFEGFKLVEWSGFGPDETISTTVETDSQGSVVKTVTTTTPQAGKTWWDLVSLIVVPGALVYFTQRLQQLQEQRSKEQEELEKKREEERKVIERERAAAEREQAEERAKQEKDIAASNTREEALQGFIECVSELLIEKRLARLLADLEENDEDDLLNAVKNVIQARTLSILRQLGDDRERKAAVILFLSETYLITRLELKLEKVDLRGVNLQSAYLSGIDLSGSNLSEANLIDARLRNANLKDVDLTKTSLMLADLTGVKGLTEYQLNQALLCQTELPQEYRGFSDRDCEKLQKSIGWMMDYNKIPYLEAKISSKQ